MAPWQSRITTLLAEQFVSRATPNSSAEKVSATLLATSLAACGADEEKVVEVPASTIASQTKAEDTKVTITEFLWDREIVCRPNPDGLFSAYWDDGSHQGYSRAESWDVVYNDYYEPVTLDVRVVPAKG